MSLKNTFLIIMTFMYVINVLNSQIGYGFTVSNDLYQRYVNPTNPLTNSASAGSAVLNLGAGPKLWLGAEKFSFSLESQAVWGIFSLSSSDYKGMGSLAFPILAKFNFKGLSTFDREMTQGWSIGGGIQYSKTEVYGISEDYLRIGLSRSFYTSYIVQVGYGVGISGFTVHGFVRYGYHPNNDGKVLNIGLGYDFNRPMLKKIKNLESEL